MTHISISHWGLFKDIDLEPVARAICKADPYAPEPDAPVYLGMKESKAWEGRVAMAKAAISAHYENRVRVVDFEV